MLVLAIMGLAWAIHIAFVHVALVAFAEAATSSATAPILVVVMALLGSGGLGYFLDRRSAQASRLAQDAVSATDVFQRSLEEERKKRDDLEQDLKEARREQAALHDKLQRSLDRQTENKAALEELQKRIDNLERSLHGTLRDMNSIIGKMFANADTDDEKISRWREAMVATKLAVVQANGQMVIAYVSPECAVLLGYSDPDELVGMPLTQVIHDDDWPVFSHAFKDAQEAESRHRTSEPIALSLDTQDGVEVPVILAIGVHRDIVTLLIRPTTAM